MADEPTNGELARGIAELRRVVEQGFGRALTVEVWRAERELLENRIHETEKDIATVEAKAEAERDKREQEKIAADNRAKDLRTQFVFALIVAFVLPVLVGVVLALIGKA